MGMESLLKKLETLSVTPATVGLTASVTAHPMPALPCTAVTSVTAPTAIDDTGTSNTSTLRLDRSANTLPHFEKATIRAWLSYIDEHDQTVIDEVLALAETNPVEKEELLTHARAAMRLVTHSDDRRYCGHCRNLTVSGRCLAAARGEILTSKNYKPILDLPQRCPGFIDAALYV